MTRPPLVREGRAFVFGDDLANDGELMALAFALARETNPAELRKHIFAGIDPEIAGQLQPGDIIVAGKRFAQGNPHIQGFIGLQGAGVGLVTESIPSGSFRLAVNAGVPLLPRCPDLRGWISAGDRLRVNFDTGDLANLTTGETRTYTPPPEHVRNIIAGGGWKPMFAARLAAARPKRPSEPGAALAK